MEAKTKKYHTSSHTYTNARVSVRQGVRSHPSLTIHRFYLLFVHFILNNRGVSTSSKAWKNHQIQSNCIQITRIKWVWNYFIIICCDYSIGFISQNRFHHAILRI